MRVLWRITRRASRYKRRLALAYLSMAVSTGSSLAVPPLLGGAVDAVLSSGGRDLLVTLALAIVGASLLRGLSGFGQMYLGEAVSQRVAYDLRNEFYDHLQRLSFAYHDKEQTGDLMSKATADVEGVRMFIQTGLIRSVHMAIMILGVGVLMALLDWRLALLSLLFVPGVAWRGAQIAMRLRETWLKVQAELGHLSTVLQENLAGQRVVKAFAAEEYEQQRFRERAANVAVEGYRAEQLHASNTALMTLFHLGATTLILWWGGREVVSGSLTAGQLTQFLFYLGLLAMPVRMAAWVVTSFSRAVAAGQRIFAVLDAESPVREPKNAVPLPRVKGHVLFEHVSFNYGSVAPVLQDITFEAKAGQVVAILGAPGSGKSTIVHLIPRFYDVTSGRVLIDGVDVRAATLSSLRANVGIALQDVFLFTATIRENIAYGVKEAPLEKVVHAAKVAQLHDFIMSLPEGYDTWVGERGVTLSGGQRQRLAIARTFLVDPPVLILDDSTSSVDAETEHLLLKALREVMKGRTTFVIAHRLSTVHRADLILVLREGEIVQRGTHQELIREPGPYQEIYELQFRPQEPLLVPAGPGRGEGTAPAPQSETSSGQRDA
ncbi:MAG: ABC transporter ATP-binding protein [Chloroflexi bacterium]|nr:ABC transporter ATP-binding protein [Chloroflexota bacterium]